MAVESVPYSRAGAHHGEAYFSPMLISKYNLDFTKQEEPKAPEAEFPANIKFIPNLDEFAARTAVTLQAGALKTDLPTGWPSTVESRMTWSGDDFQDESKFVYHLSDEEKMEVDSALKYFRAQGIESIKLTRDVFPLPNFSKYLEKVRDEVYNGIGFMILRGLDVDSYSLDDLATILLGVSSYVAPLRGIQNQLGSVIKHIVDYGKVEAEVDLPFHTDVTCDVVATITRECSFSGGMATLASSSKVYNYLATARPDLVHVLSQPDWPFDTYGRDPLYYRRAILYHEDNNVIFNYSRRVLVGHPLAPRTKGIPGLTEAQAEALDAVHYIAKAYQLKLSMERGDLRLINNIGLLHGREGYSDENDEQSKRHLIRAWLHNEAMAWKLPPALQLVWDRTFRDDTRPTRWQAEPQRGEGGEGEYDRKKRADSPSGPCD